MPRVDKEKELLKQILAEVINERKTQKGEGIEAPYPPTTTKPKATPKQIDHLAKAREARKLKTLQRKKEQEEQRIAQLVEKKYQEKEAQRKSKEPEDLDENTEVYVPRSRKIEKDYPTKKEELIDKYMGIFG